MEAPIHLDSGGMLRLIEVSRGVNCWGFRLEVTLHVDIVYLPMAAVVLVAYDFHVAHSILVLHTSHPLMTDPLRP